MSKRNVPAGEYSESRNKVVKVKTEDGEEEINVGAMSVEVAVAVLSNLPLHIQDCTLSDKEKACAIKCAKLALLEKDGQQARSQYIRQELVEMLGGDWMCIVGGYGGMSLEGPHLKFRYGQDSIFIMKQGLAADLSVNVIECVMEDSKEKDAILTIKSACVLFKTNLEIAGHVKKEFDTKYGKSWTCSVSGPDGFAAVAYSRGNYMKCTCGQVVIRLFKSHY